MQQSRFLKRLPEGGGVGTLKALFLKVHSLVSGTESSPISVDRSFLDRVKGSWRYMKVRRRSLYLVLDLIRDLPVELN